MKIVFFAAITLLTIAAACLVAYQQRPVSITASYVVTHMVEEAYTDSTTKTVEVNGQKFEIPVENTHTKELPVYETKTRVIEPSWKDRLRFGVIVFATGFLAIVAVIVLIAWARDLFSNRPANARSRKVEKMMEHLFTFALGVVGGIVGVGSLQENSTKTDQPPHAAEAIPDTGDVLPQSQAEPPTSQPMLPIPPRYRTLERPPLDQPTLPSDTPETNGIKRDSK